MKTNILSIRSFDLPRHLAFTAWAEHIPFSFELISRLRPKLIVELGVHNGVSYFAFCQAIKTNNLPCSCYAVDTWIGDEHAGFYGDEVYKNVVNHNSENYASFSYLLRSSFADALSYFEDKTIDLLHIVGLHTYEAVKSDFETWLPKLSDSSIVLFHDISVRERGFGVFRLWEELSLKYPSFSFIHGYGLGVLATGKDIPVDIQALFKYADSEEIEEIRSCYYHLGSSISEKLKLKQSYERSIGRLQLELENKVNEMNTVSRELETLREAMGISNNNIE
jgi:hypothetical protein